MSVAIVAVIGESVQTRTVKRRGVPTIVHEVETLYRLECGHEVTRRRPLAQFEPRTVKRLRFCDRCIER